MESAKVDSSNVICLPRVLSDDRDPLLKAIQNPLIVDEISKYISLVDMISCRTASCLWKNEWTHVIQKRSKFQLCFTDKTALLIKDARICRRESPDLVLRLDSAESNNRLNSLFRWISKNFHNFPCSKSIRVGTQVFNSVDQSVQGTFFRAISNIVTELCLENSYTDQTFNSIMLDELEVEFTNLKALVIHCWRIDKERFSTAFRFVGMVIQLVPNLDTLRFFSDMSCMQRDSDALLTGCISAISNPKQIKTLQMNGIFTDDLLEKLAEKKLTLKEFSVCFGEPSNFSSEKFNTFLSSQSSSLEKFYCQTESLNRENLQERRMSIPQMPMVHLLEIGFFEGLNFSGLSLQQAFPKLKHLKMIGVPDFCGGMYASDLVPQPIFVPATTSPPDVPSVEELDLNFIGHNNAILHVCTMFPRVKRLRIPANMEYILAVNAASMNSLEEITLCQMMYYGDDMYEALTGYSKAKLLAAGQSGISGEMQRQPQALLDRAKILRLENTSLTDLVCIMGPMKLQSLQCLDLRISDPNKKHQISKATLEKMRERFIVLLED